MNLRRANDFGRRPGPLGIRRVDNATSNNNLVATTARNHQTPSVSQTLGRPSDYPLSMKNSDSDVSYCYGNLNIQAFRGVHEEVAERVVNNVATGSKICDLGAGTLALSARLADGGGYEVTAVDWEKQSNYESHRVNFIELNLADATAVEAFAKQHRDFFDAVVGVEVIEHLENPWAYVSLLLSILKPGGFLVVTTPNISGWHSRLRFLRSGIFDNFGGNPLDGDHINPITPWEIDMIFRRKGITGVLVGSVGDIYVLPTFPQKLFTFAGKLLSLLQPHMLKGCGIVASGFKSIDGETGPPDGADTFYSRTS